MRPSTALMMAVLPLVLAHTPALERRARHAEIGRQLIGRPTEEDVDASSSTAFNTVAPPRSSLITTAPTSSAVATTSRVTTTTRSSIVGTSVIGTSAPVVSGSASPTLVSSGVVLPSSSNGTVSGSLSSNGTSASSTASLSASASASSASASASAVIHTSVDAGGNIVVVTQFVTPSATPVSSAAAAASSTTPPSSDGPAISVGAIIGISVAVGVVILGLIGCAVWRMKRRGSDEDEAIRWPELNRHGDSDTHHALPARATGKHGIETDALERSLSNSSEVYMSQNPNGRPPSMPMALGGSNFGAASALDYTYNDKDAPTAGYDYGYPSYHPDSATHPSQDPYDREHEDYSNLPPPLATQPAPAGPGMYDSDSDGDHGAGHGRAGGPATAPPVYRG